MRNRDVLISGASVAGPALAYWLRRYGFNPTVVERAPAPRGGGQAVDLRGGGRDVAERMSIMDSVRAAHTGAHGVAFVNGSGRRVATMSAELLGDSGGIIADIEILRGDLVRILHDATRNGVEYIFDDSITRLIEDADGVEVTLEHGGRRRFDLVVGADGLHSNVRSLVFGDESRHVRDLGCYLSIFGVANHLGLDGWELMYTSPGRTAAIYPLGPDRANAFFFFASPELRYDRRDVGEQKGLLASAMAGAGWEVPRLLEAMGQAPDFYLDRVALVQMDRWSEGRTVLIGDAAHCPSPIAGMGTSLALVGAYILAGELAAAAGDHRLAYARYEAEMREGVQQSQKLADGAGFGLIPRFRAQIWLRNVMMRALPHTPWRSALAGGVQRAATAITLKDYARGPVSLAAIGT